MESLELRIDRAQQLNYTKFLNLKKLNINTDCNYLTKSMLSNFFNAKFGPQLEELNVKELDV